MKNNTLIYAMIILFLLVLTGCSKDTIEKNGDYSEPPSTPGFFKIDNMEYKMRSGGYSWKGKQGSETVVVQTDHAGPVQMAEDFKAIMIDPGETIHIEIKESPQLEVYLWNKEESENIKVSENKISAASDKGQHIYEVVAKWEGKEASKLLEPWESGEVSYTFVVDIQ